MSVADLTIGLIGPVPPRRCSVAEETAWMAREFAAAGAEVRLVAVGDLDADIPWNPGLPGAERPALRALVGVDVVIIHHRAGLHGPNDAAGNPLIRFLQRSPAPTVLVLHDVPTITDPVGRDEIAALVRLADAVVVQSDVAHRRVTATGQTPSGGVHTIPRAAALGTPSAPPRPAGPDRPTVLTFGFLDPDKGIEDGVVAMAALNDLSSPVRYIITGPTSTETLELEDEHYRSGIRILAKALKVEDRIFVDDSYLSPADLARVVHDADVVLLPYVGSETTSSAVLVEALSAGRPIVSTAFPHAVELLADGAGILVSPGDHQAMTNALRQVLTRPRTAADMRTRALDVARRFEPDAVIKAHLDLLRRLRPVHDLRPVRTEVEEPVAQATA